MAASTYPPKAKPARSGDGFDFAGALGDEWDAHEEEAQSEKRPLREYAELMPIPGVGAMRFEDFPFHEEWFSEEVANATEVVTAKGAQIGKTEAELRWAFQQVDQYGRTGLYVMPTDEMAEKIADERVEPSIEESPYLKSKIKPKWVRSKKLKRIGRGFLHMRGSNSKAGAQSIAASFLVLDERDLLDQGNLAHILRRVSGAKQLGLTPKVHHLGYPLLPNTGIDLLWQESDQRVWHVTCRECEDEQPITWEENVRWTMPGRRWTEEEREQAEAIGCEVGDPRVFRPGDDEFESKKVVGRVWRQCRSCRASLEDTPGAVVKDGALRKGRWIAKNPGAPIIGYHAWRGMVPVTDLEALVVASRGTTEAEREAFAALDLGRAYSAGKASLTDEDLANAQRDGLPSAMHAYMGPHPVTMGVDVGDEKGIHVQIDEQLPTEVHGIPNRRRTLWAGKVSSFEELCGLIERFRVWVVAIDYNPERRLARTLRATYPGRVVMVEFGGNDLSEPLKIDLDEANVPLRALVNRTDVIDGMMDGVRQRRQVFLQQMPPGWAAQMKALHRITELNTRGVPVRKYITTGTDGEDYGMAATYALVATELWRAFGGMRQAIEAQQGHHMPDEELGFQRLRLGFEGADTYRAGFGEEG